LTGHRGTAARAQQEMLAGHRAKACQAGRMMADGLQQAVAVEQRTAAARGIGNGAAVGGGIMSEETAAGIHGALDERRAWRASGASRTVAAGEASKGIAGAGNNGGAVGGGAVSEEMAAGIHGAQDERRAWRASRASRTVAAGRDGKGTASGSNNGGGSAHGRWGRQRSTNGGNRWYQRGRGQWRHRSVRESSRWRGRPNDSCWRWVCSSDAQRANSAMKSTKEPHQRCAECTPTRCRNGAAKEEQR
jgi:hypothetical protein